MFSLINKKNFQQYIFFLSEYDYQFLLIVFFLSGLIKFMGTKHPSQRGVRRTRYFTIINIINNIFHYFRIVWITRSNL